VITEGLDDRPSPSASRDDWERFWAARRPSLRWDATRARWVVRAPDAPHARAWPPVPRDHAPPRVAGLDAILAALDSGDAARFEAAMIALLDDGIGRDRALRGATTTESARWPGADQAGLTWQSPPPLGAIATLRDRARPSRERAAALAGQLLHARFAAFAAERAAAARDLEAMLPCDERVRRAAWWELSDNHLPGPAHVALTRLAGCDEPAARTTLDAMARLRSDGAIQRALAARRRLQAIRVHLPAPADVSRVATSALPARDATGTWRSPTGRAASAIFVVGAATTVYAFLDDNAFWLHEAGGLDRWRGPYPLP